MSIIQALIGSFSNVLGAVYRVLHSLRFDGSADYLSWSNPSASNRTTNTFSFWFKPMENAVNSAIFFQQRNTGSTQDLQFNVLMLAVSGRNSLRIMDQDNAGIDILLDSGTDLDFEAGTWYHLVVAVNTNEGTNTDRVKVWIDGQQYTNWSSPTWPSSGHSTGINRASTRMLIGVQRPNTSSTLNTYSNVQLAEYHFIDGTAYDASYFGETRGGQWVPKEVTGVTYGTNGFYLPFDRRTEGVTLLLDGTSTTDDVANYQVFETVANVTTQSIGGPNTIVRPVLDFGSSTPTTGHIIDTNPTSLPQGAEDFTVEFWFRQDYVINSVSRTLFAGINGIADTQLDIFLDSTNKVNYYHTSSTKITGTAILDHQTWYHIAAVRKDGTTTLYVDGASQGSFADTGSYAVSSHLGIGAYYDGTSWVTGGNSLQGQMTDVRVTRGIARDIAAEWTAGTYTSPLTNDIQYGSLGRDASTNTNNFTVPANTITPDDQLLDSPNLRFATWDTASVAVTLSEGNLKTTHGAADEAIASESSALVGGKFYCELYWATGTNLMPQVRAAAAASEYSGYFNDGTKNGVEGAATYGSSYGVGSIIGCAVDATTSKVWWRLNGVWQGTGGGDPSSTLVPATSSGFTGNPPLYFALSDGTTADTGDTSIANFGQDHTFAGSLAPLASPFTDDDGNGEFYYQPPAGFKALVTSY